eukprot:7270928-Prymnesium_polylepis.1
MSGEVEEAVVAAGGEWRSRTSPRVGRRGNSFGNSLILPAEWQQVGRGSGCRNPELFSSDSVFTADRL